MTGHLLPDLPATAPGAEVWEDHQPVIVATPTPAGVPTYVLTSTVRQTRRMVITTEGTRFWKHTLTEVGGTRQIIPDFAPVYPILAAQLAAADHRKAIGAAYWEFTAHPDRAHAHLLATAVDAFLTSPH